MCQNKRLLKQFCITFNGHNLEFGKKKNINSRDNSIALSASPQVNSLFVVYTISTNETMIINVMLMVLLRAYFGITAYSRSWTLYAGRKTKEDVLSHCWKVKENYRTFPRNSFSFEINNPRKATLEIKQFYLQALLAVMCCVQINLIVNISGSV